VNKLLVIGCGGFIGSVFRYWVSTAVQQWMRSAYFPYGTLVVNVLGCLVIGFLSQWADARGVFTDRTRAFVFVGILGGFTTFSTFCNESFNLFQAGDNRLALANVGGQVVLGLGAVWVGRTLAYWLWR
jgi:CrcB protein